MNKANDTYAWVMVAVCTAMVAMAFGAIGTVAVFLEPLAAEFGWPRADVAAAYSVATVATGLGGIAMGYFADRMPVRRVALFGALVPGLAFVFLAELQTTRGLYGLHAMMGLVGVGAIMAPLNSLASLWLARNPGLAIGIVSAGGAAGQGLVPYFARHLILTEGWRQAYLTLGVLFIGLMVPLALLLRDAPRQTGVRPASAGGRATRLLALLSLAAALCCICMATPLVHVVTLGSDRGLAGRDAAGLLAVMMVSGMAGRIAFGRIADRVGSLQTYIAASAGQTLLALLFPYAAGGMQLYALSVLFGLVFSGAMSSFLICAREYAPAGKTGLSIGVVMFFAWVGMALGAWQGGLFYDLCGDYFRSFANASLGGAANLLVLALLYIYTRKRVLTPFSLSELLAAPRSAAR
ncbi:MAG TPA: MFS transporter [Burkholderiales bacterium]|nr:MFS transporter [Burkholderiales bacterium]